MATTLTYLLIGAFLALGLTTSSLLILAITAIILAAPIIIPTMVLLIFLVLWKLNLLAGMAQSVDDEAEHESEKEKETESGGSTSGEHEDLTDLVSGWWELDALRDWQARTWEFEFGVEEAMGLGIAEWGL